MTRREVIEELKRIKKIVVNPQFANPQFNQLFDEVLKMFPQAVHAQAQENDKKTEETFDIVIEILENMSDERFEARGNKCRLN